MRSRAPLLRTLGGVETLLAEFVNAVDATRNGSPDVESLFAAVDPVFDGFVSQLRDAFSAPRSTSGIVEFLTDHVAYAPIPCAKCAATTTVADVVMTAE